MDAAKDGGAMLRIEFPKGDYLPNGAAASAARPGPRGRADARAVGVAASSRPSGL